MGVWWGCAWPGGGGGGMRAGEMATEAGGTHPTGMHSCDVKFRHYILFLFFKVQNSHIGLAKARHVLIVSERGGQERKHKDNILSLKYATTYQGLNFLFCERKKRTTK